MTAHTTWDDLLRPGGATDFFARRTLPPFDPSSAHFVPANALWLAELSRIVYRHDAEEEAEPPQPARTRFLDEAGFATRRFLWSRATNTQALVLMREAAPRFAVVAFRGTEQTPADFRTDLRFLKRRWDGGPARVHRGFLEALDSVWDALAAELDALAALDAPCFYAGHSLGAALATLAGVRRPPVAVYAFGSPRVGNAAFAALAGRIALHRIVDARDVVTRVPPQWLGYRHAGDVVVLQREAGSGGLGGEGSSGSSGSGGPPGFLADHAPVNYVDRIPLA